MSFEGFYQRLCTNGHYSEEDVYMSSSEDYYTCYVCGEKLAWWNLVDTTNIEPVGFVNLKCGDFAGRTFKIPKNKGNKHK